MSFCSSPGQTFLISLYGGKLRSAFELSHSEFGAIYSIATLLSGFLVIWTGKLVDELDPRSFSLAVVLVLAVGLFTASVSAGAVTLFAAFFLLRHSGQGLMMLISATLLIRHIPQSRGKAVAVSKLGYVSAEAVMPALTFAAIATLGWRGSLQATAAAILVLALPAIYLLLRSYNQRYNNSYLNPLSASDPVVGDDLIHASRSDVLRDKRFYLALPAIMSASMMFTGFFFHQIALVEEKNWSLQWWAGSFALYALSSLCMTVITGPLVDRFRGVKVLPLCLLPLAIGLVLIAFFDSLWAGIAFLVLTGMTTGAAAIATPPVYAEVWGTRHLGAIKAVGTAIMVFASALSPVAMGWLIDNGVSLASQALIAGIYILVAVVLMQLAFRNAKLHC